uniref:Putative secreted protein n=1 Tax=Anopheles darlingi TaxID=43151 RepID=A0A2M4D634_ANODA
MLLLLLWMCCCCCCCCCCCDCDVGIANATGRFDRSPVGLRINNHFFRVHAVRGVRGVQRIQYRPHVLIDLESFR